MLFADTALCDRIESAACRFGTDVAAAIRQHDKNRAAYVAEIGGGAAVHLGYEAPFNKLAGVGIHGPLSASEVERLGEIEREFSARKTPLQAEICTLADNSIARLLTRRGYLLMAFENVLGLRLDEALIAQLESATSSPELRIETVDASDDAAWLDALISGFAQPDVVPGGESHESYPREAIEQAMRDMVRASGISRYIAHRDGVVAGGASLRSSSSVAQLSGSATLLAHRRRGVQTALLSRRLIDAYRSGCDVAVITTQPGSKSQQNAQRRGFQLLYSRAILVLEARPSLNAC